jgi:DNA helicase-2/ATP-dependent DNA helicase PcrA
VRALAVHMGAGDTTRRLVQKVEMLFGQDNRQDVLRLCTIHRSKGREWERVFLIGRNQYQPSRYAETEEEKAQEDNLVYVAITRVKKELVEVTVPGKASRESPEWWEL